MFVYLHTKFQVSSIILTGLLHFQPPPLPQNKSLLSTPRLGLSKLYDISPYFCLKFNTFSKFYWKLVLIVEHMYYISCLRFDINILYNIQTASNSTQIFSGTIQNIRQSSNIFSNKHLITLATCFLVYSSYYYKLVITIFVITNILFWFDWKNILQYMY